MRPIVKSLIVARRDFSLGLSVMNDEGLRYPNLIATKLRIPAAVRLNVHRARLDELLHAGAQRKVTVLAAPAGFGKTVLVASWMSAAAASGRLVGWVSLDSGDNDPATFWSYVLAAIDRMEVTIAAGGGVPVETLGPESAEVLPALVNALAAQTNERVLVLDDYHLITDPRIHRDLTFLVEQELPHFHLMVLSRSDPPFLSSRRRASGDVVEVRARDLAFNRDETAAFLEDHGVVLDNDLREALFARVAGWAAALRLAAIWVAGSKDQSTAVTEFAAADFTMTDYLTVEVLGQLSPELRRFLLLTSISARLSGPLCDAITGERGGEQTLNDLERRGLFVDQLDSARGWFCYHQLFAELLRQELSRSYPDEVPELHRRAARWFAANGFIDDAIEHTLLAQDWPGLRTLLLGQARSIGVERSPSNAGFR
jgi:LuxR family transcriptional regulator, maltose regulon positive regulatory protein